MSSMNSQFVRQSICSVCRGCRILSCVRVIAQSVLSHLVFTAGLGRREGHNSIPTVQVRTQSLEGLAQGSTADTELRGSWNLEVRPPGCAPSPSDATGSEKVRPLQLLPVLLWETGGRRVGRTQGLQRHPGLWLFP